MKLLVGLLTLLMLARGDVVYIDSGYVGSIRKVGHGAYTHTVVHFTITSSVQPIEVVIWLYNDERRLITGDHVRLERRLYGTDDGVKDVKQCMATAPEVEPCALMEIVAIKWLGE